MRAVSRNPLINSAFVGLLCVAGNLSLGIYPIFVTGVTALGRANAGQVGLLAAAEFLPFALVTIFGAKLIPENHLRRTTGVCLFIQLLAAYATIRLPFGMLLIARAVFGSAGGGLIWVVYTYAGRSAHPGRLVAIYTTALLLVGVLWSWAGPSVIAQAYGPEGLILFLAAPSLLALLLLPFGPKQLPAIPDAPPDEKQPASDRSKLSTSALLLLVSVWLWSMYMSIFWVYADPIAAAYKGGLVRHWLTLSLIGQIVGAALSASLADTLPYRGTISVGLLISIAQVISIALGIGGNGFVVGATIYGFLGYFLAPFFIAGLIQADPSRRSVAYFPAVQNLASSIGPLLVSQIVSDTDLSSGLIVDVIALCLSLLALWTALTLLRYRPIMHAKSTELEHP